MPIDLGSPLSAADVANLNAAARTYNPTAAEVKTLAVDNGVSVRTVQRWFTGGGQVQRAAMVPQSAVGKTLGQLSEGAATRVVDAARLGNIRFEGVAEQSARTERGIKPGSYEVRFDSYADAREYARTLEKGGIDEWLDGAWNRIQFGQSGAGWTVSVDYSKDWSDT